MSKLKVSGRKLEIEQLWCFCPIFVYFNIKKDPMEGFIRRGLLIKGIEHKSKEDIFRSNCIVFTRNNVIFDTIPE